MAETPRSIVPCGACSLCCRFGVTPVGHVEQAREHYDAQVVKTEKYGLVWALKKRPNGACVYLDDGGKCSIWERAPETCRAFDCRREYATFDRATRRRMGRETPLWREIWKAAAARGATAERKPA